MSFWCGSLPATPLFSVLCPPPLLPVHVYRFSVALSTASINHTISGSVMTLSRFRGGGGDGGVVCVCVCWVQRPCILAGFTWHQSCRDMAMRGGNPTPTAKRFNSTGIDMEENLEMVLARTTRKKTTQLTRTAKSSQQRRKTKDFCSFRCLF